MEQKSNIINAFTEDQVERLTGVTKGQLRYWDKTGFFKPGLEQGDHRSAFNRIYSFRDLVSLQVLNALKNDHGVSLPHLRKVKEKLSNLHDNDWGKITLYVLNRKVIFPDPQTGQPTEVVSGQFVVPIPLASVRSDMRAAVKKMWSRNKSTVGVLARNRLIVHNQLVIDGTRVPVRSIREFHDAGFNISQIKEQYPHLKNKDIEAALSENKVA